VEEDPFAEEMGGFPPPPFQFEEATSSSIAGESSSKKEILDGPSKKVLDASAAGNNNNNFCASNDDCPKTFLCLENVCECPPEKVRLGDKCVDDDRADYYPEEGFADDGLLLEETENFGKEGGKEEQKMSPIEQMFATLALFKEIGKKDNKDDAEEASDGRIPPIGKKGSENIGGDDSEIATRRTNLPTTKNSSTTQPPPNGVVEKGVVKVDSLIDLPKKMSKKEKSLLAEEELMRQRRETTRVRSSNPAVAPDFGIRLSGEPCKPVCLATLYQCIIDLCIIIIYT
jgi:hypothetical protein